VAGPVSNLTGPASENLACVRWVTARNYGSVLSRWRIVPSFSFMGVSMGVLDKLFGDGGKGAKGKADFSDVRSGGPSTAPASQGTAGRQRTYTVVAGDSLSKIAKREYGDASKWPRIFEANRDKIQNPDLIHPGQVLNLP